ncbi:hypothetical protein C0J52_27533 [Blattella germanica]|nr:hypothetical protein C0J52_27533 [Blattella germanica]
MATMEQKLFCILEFARRELQIVAQRVFCTKFGIKPPTRKNIKRWFTQFQKTESGKTHADRIYQRMMSDVLKKDLLSHPMRLLVKEAVYVSLHPISQDNLWNHITAAMHSAMVDRLTLLWDKLSYCINVAMQQKVNTLNIYNIFQKNFETSTFHW